MNCKAYVGLCKNEDHSLIITALEYNESFSTKA